MAAAFLSSALTAVFAALLLSPPGAGAEVVTWRKCKEADYYPDWWWALVASPNRNATKMVLDHCNLTEVRSGDFDGLPNVVNIELSNNAIAHVDPAAFRTVPKLTYLTLHDNDLREAPVFDEHSFCPSLTVLHLSRNRITAINDPKTFSGCTELQELLIYYNVIEYIQSDVFRPLGKLTYLDISHNKIIAIPETLFIKNNKLNFLSLADNKITVIPETLFINTNNLTFLTLNDNKIQFLPSDFASKIRNAGAPLRWFLFHGNPWHCACLLEVLADVKRAGVLYTGTKPECVYDGAYPCSRQVSTGLLRRAGPGQ